ncbi:FAD-dependent thymidylate synthase [Gordonia westfalica]|uniref:FAD-dependent thymidylate synthase n=1 Tax=Gordonia westfalica TaxID=158898 RepID=A0ABU2GVJ9_9ACTN|nr:FAD-dependent thymidylate synthase [Gordonia westfalica]MDS1115492.1 FAD-dependent thymidylate synthase [Gordonia westfalica]
MALNAVQHEAPLTGRVEEFTDDERDFLLQYVTNVDEPVFALINLPEVVKGALFARYSRSSKPLRRLLLDEFREDLDGHHHSVEEVSHQRAESLYSRVFTQFGDDSIAQLGGVHLACEGASNILTKVLERGRLASYLEQSTRYIPYDELVNGQWNYHVPTELSGSLLHLYRRTLDHSFEVYSDSLKTVYQFLLESTPRPANVSEPAFSRTMRARSLDACRGLLPAATRSNLGIYASGQAYEALLLRMRASSNSEVLRFADLILAELRKVIPSFMTRVDLPDRGLIWSEYIASVAQRTQSHAVQVAEQRVPSHESYPTMVDLVDFDPEGELKTIAAALYPYSSASDRELMSIVCRMSHDERVSILRDYVGTRLNRRHKPGRGFERTSYRFDIVADYGAFRDLQRHRLLTIDWQSLTPELGYTVDPLIEQAGLRQKYDSVMKQSAALHRSLVGEGHVEVAQYSVAMGFRIRFYMQMNAREAMHILELRSAPQGHESYRLVSQQMHSLIRDQAKHYAIADAMNYVDHHKATTGRLESEIKTDGREIAGGD